MSHRARSSCRTGARAKGYHREMFNEAFERYLSQSPFPKRNPVTTPEITGDFTFSETSPAKDGLRTENEEIANKDAEGDGGYGSKARGSWKARR